MEANHRLVSIANYSISSLTIGEGSFSKVKVARHKVLQKNVALKVIKISSIKDPYVIKNLEREAKILVTLHHNNVVR
jgi:serine/threonine protein kinase